MPENLQLKFAEENRTVCKNLHTLMYKSENIKSIYLEETNKILNGLPMEIRE